MKNIALTRGYFASVDDADFEWLNAHKWYANLQRPRPDGTRRVYASRRDRSRAFISMHVAIMRPNCGLVVDHIDHDGLNNRRANLRCVTNRENLSNQIGKHLLSSRFVGVHQDSRGRGWRASISIDGRTRHLGSFADERQAADCYRAAVLELQLCGSVAP